MPDSLLPAAARAAEGGRPRTRGECAGGARPCPFLTCRHHLMTPPPRSLAPTPADLAELEQTVMTRLERGDETCSLDVADRVRRDEITLAEIGDLIGPDRLCQERVRQIETRGLLMLKKELRRARVETDPLIERDTKPHKFLRRGGAGSQR